MSSRIELLQIERLHEDDMYSIKAICHIRPTPGTVVVLTEADVRMLKESQTKLVELHIDLENTNSVDACVDISKDIQKVQTSVAAILNPE